MILDYWLSLLKLLWDSLRTSLLPNLFHPMSQKLFSLLKNFYLRIFHLFNPVNVDINLNYRQTFFFFMHINYLQTFFFFMHISEFTWDFKVSWLLYTCLFSCISIHTPREMESSLLLTAVFMDIRVFLQYSNLCNKFVLNEWTNGWIKTKKEKQTHEWMNNGRL